MNHRRYTYLVGEDILLLKRRYTSFLKETHRSFIRSGMGALLLMLLLLTACVGEELQKPILGEGEGYLRLQVAPVSAEISTSPLTKAMVPNAPTEGQLTITITNKSTGDSRTYANISAVPDPLVLKAGVTYTVAASYGTDDTLQYIPYFYGSEEVTIQANTNNPVTVSASLANAMIIPVVTDSLKRHYDDGWTLTASTNNTTKPFPLTFTNGTCTFYAKAGETVSLNFKGKNKAGETADATWKSISNVEACKAYTVECNPNLAAFYNIQVNAIATHTDRDGNLNGTEVTFSADLHEANEKAIDSWTVKVCKSDGQIIRTYTGKSLSSMTYSDTDWPYIPQGSTLSASVKLKAGDEITVGSTFALPAPDFRIEVSGDTSYSVYRDTNRGAAEANTKDGSSIFNIGSTVKISSAILGNSNYANILPKVTYTTDTGKSSGELAYNASVGDFTDLAWQKHVLTATASFDGAKAYASKECEVTGLPYNAEPPTKNEWEYSEFIYKWESDYVRLHINNTIYKSFYIPQNIDVYIFQNIYVNCGAEPTTYTLTVSGKVISTISPETGNKPQSDQKTYQAVLTQSDPKVSCHNTYGNPPSYLFGKYYEGTHTKVYKISVEYR